LETDLGLPCTFSFSRTAGVKPDNAAVREAVRSKPPLVMFGSVNERMYMAEAGARGCFVPASYPGALIRRHTGTPFMGYAGATYLVQEVCNALFDALFHIIPLGSQLDRIEATPAKSQGEIAWDDAAKAAFDQIVDAQPVLVRISVAKRLRDAAERLARAEGANRVTPTRLARAHASVFEGQPA
jgi:chlorophyllide a reductase subunit Z